MRPLALGHRAWLFSDTQAGAEASCGIYSIATAARANNLMPMRYQWAIGSSSSVFSPEWPRNDKFLLFGYMSKMHSDWRPGETTEKVISPKQGLRSPNFPTWAFP